MANTSGNAYALTTLCPIINGTLNHQAHDKYIRMRIQELDTHENSLFALAPETYTARLFILNDVFFQQGNDVKQDHLKSHYLAFTATFHGDRDEYLINFWNHAEDHIKTIWQHCVGFSDVQDGKSFAEYIGRCQLKTTLFFNGSSDRSLQEQLKALYIKDRFTHFALSHQGKSPTAIRQAFSRFLEENQLTDYNGPTFRPGQEHPTEIHS